MQTNNQALYFPLRRVLTREFKDVCTQSDGCSTRRGRGSLWTKPDVFSWAVQSFSTSGESTLASWILPPRSPPWPRPLFVRRGVGTSGPPPETSAPRPLSAWVPSGNTEEGIRGSKGPPPPLPPLRPGRCCSPPPPGCTADCTGRSHRGAWLGLVWGKVWGRKVDLSQEKPDIIQALDVRQQQAFEV